MTSGWLPVVLGALAPLVLPWQARAENPFLLNCRMDAGATVQLRVVPPRFAVIGQMPTVQRIGEQTATDVQVRQYDDNFLVVDLLGRVQPKNEVDQEGWIRISINRNTLGLVFELFRRTGMTPPSGLSLDTDRGSCTLDRPRF